MCLRKKEEGTMMMLHCGGNESEQLNKRLKQLLIVDPRVLEQPQLAPVGCASPASAASFSLAVMSS